MADRFYPFEPAPCRTCTGADIFPVEETKELTASNTASPQLKADVSTKDVTTSTADPVLQTAEAPKPSFLTTPLGAVVSVGGVAVLCYVLVANMGTTRGSPRLT